MDEYRAPRDAAFWIGVALSLFHLWLNTFGTLPELAASALHFGGFGLLCVLLFPLRPDAGPGFRLLDLSLGLLAVGCALYLVIAEVPLYQRGMSFVPTDWLFSALAVLLAMEFARRTSGWVVPALVVIALSYVLWWGSRLGGVFHFPGLSMETVLLRAYFGSDGLFGPIARISWSYVFMFILFGAFLTRSGASDFIIRLARVTAGRLVGGPGLVAVVGSGLMGSVSGAAIANTVSTGVVTIPLMKRAGYPARFAAGVEAAASTGGQLMPPVMGAGAFIMASYTQVPYTRIIALAALPAILYFLSIAFFVRIQARKQGLVAGDAGGERLGTVLRDGWPFLLAMGVLIGLMLTGYTPVYAAAWSILAVIASSWLGSRPLGIQGVLDALALGARNMTAIAMLLVAVGLVVNAVTTTGIGNTLSLMLHHWAGGSLFIAIVLIALASLVLGMGLPVTASYIVLGTLSAPALFELMSHAELARVMATDGLNPQLAATLSLLLPEQAAALSGPAMSPDAAAAFLHALPPEFLAMIREQTLDPVRLSTLLVGAHMIIYWLSQDSNVTPPVCLTAYAAAGIAGTRPLATGLTAWKLAKGLYIIPLLFAWTPLTSGDWGAALEVFLFALFGLYALAGAMEGHLERPVGWFGRVLLTGTAAGLMWPELPLSARAGALALLLVILFWRRRPIGHSRRPDRA
ncbi:MAG: TRAP transporter fused permease subunit [Pseudomonadota bacterium]